MSDGGGDTGGGDFGGGGGDYGGGGGDYGGNENTNEYGSNNYHTNDNYVSMFSQVLPFVIFFATTLMKTIIHLFGSIIIITT